MWCHINKNKSAGWWQNKQVIIIYARVKNNFNYWIVFRSSASSWLLTTLMSLQLLSLRTDESSSFLLIPADSGRGGGEQLRLLLMMLLDGCGCGISGRCRWWPSRMESSVGRPRVPKCGWRGWCSWCRRWCCSTSWIGCCCCWAAAGWCRRLILWWRLHLARLLENQTWRLERYI